MSYGTNLYAVDIERLQTAFGSQDSALWTAIQEQYQEDFKHSNNWFESKIAQGAPTVEKALQDIIAGHITHSESGFQYGYALEYLCRHFGQIVGDGDVFGNLEDLEIETSLLQAKLPIPIPAPHDFPFISYLTHQEVNDELQRIEGLDLSYPSDEDIEEARYDFRECLETTKETGCAIVSFYY